MINKPPPFKGLDSRMSIVIPIKGRGVINQGSGSYGTAKAKKGSPTLTQLRLPEEHQGLLPSAGQRTL